MKKILLALLCLPSIALAAQQEITAVPDSPVLPSIGSLKDAVNLRLADIDENFDEIYPIIAAGPVYVNASAPADTKVVWIDTDQDNAIKVHVGGVWTVVGTTGEGSYTLPTAAADTLGGIKVGSRLTITDGVLSADVQTGGGDDLGSAAYTDVVALWTTCTGYLKSDGTCDTPSGSATYPSAAGVANWNGSAWGTSYTVGTAANNLVQLNASAQLPAVSASLLTNFPTLNQDTTGTAGGLSDQYIDWSASSGGTSIANKPSLGTVAALDYGTDVGDLVRLVDDGEGGPALPFTIDLSTLTDTAGILTGKLSISDIDDTPIDGETNAPISSNYVYDHVNAADPHAGYVLESSIGSTVQAYDTDLTTWAGITPGSGVGTFLTTPSSTNLAAAVTGETGSGALVFGTSPGFTTSANPGSADGATLGTATLEWSDLYLASGGVIYGEDDQANTITSSSTGFSFNLPLGLYSANDPDVTAEGRIAWDANGDTLRSYDGTRQVAVARAQKEIQATIIKPNDLDDAQRDAFLVWSNNSGMPFVVTGWHAWSTSDDTDFNIEETDVDGANNTTVDAVSITTNGTGVYYANDSTITAGTVEDGHLLWLDFDDTDDPAQVHVTIYGYYDADVN